MGAFGEHAADFIDRGIAVVPTSGDDGKRPAIKGWQRLGLNGSKRLIESGKFDDANAAIVPGPRSKLTVLDIDQAGSRALADALTKYGDTPIVIQTGSGKYQAYYRHNGEGRMIRPIEGENIDILGSGIALAPPSVRPDKGGAKYKFIRGGLDDLARLPELRNVPETRPQAVQKRASVHDGVVGAGNRTNDLFAALRAVSSECATLDDLTARAIVINAARYQPLLSESEVMQQVQGVWKLIQEGRCFAPGSRSAVFPVEDILALAAYPPAMVLDGYLRAHHANDHIFSVSPKGLADKLKISHPTIARARDFLIKNGRLKLVQRGRKLRDESGNIRNTPDQYRLPPG